MFRINVGVAAALLIEISGAGIGKSESAQERPTNEQDLFFSWRLLDEARSDERGRKFHAMGCTRQRILWSYAICCMNRMIRKLAFGTTISVMAAAAQSAERVDVWVLLTEPPTASGAGAPELVKKQQQAVMAALQALGAVELGRVSLTRNAIAVSIDQAKLPQVKQLSGVRSVSPVRNIEREPPAPPVR